MTKEFIGPYLCGEKMSMGDIVMAPYFARMKVLEYYRKFFVP
jgi:glutathione S-transferase